MRKQISVVMGVGLLGLGMQSQAADYLVTLQFDDVDKGWSASGPSFLWPTLDLNDLGGSVGTANATAYYNSQANTAVGDCVNPSVAFFRYSCLETASFSWQPSPTLATAEATAQGPTLQGTVSVDEGTGTATGIFQIGTLDLDGNFTEGGYDYRSADGSPFVNVWWGVSEQATLSVTWTGTFAGLNWDITGGTAAFVDPAGGCQTGNASPTLCSDLGVIGTWTALNEQFSWIDVPVREVDAAGGALIATLAGSIASVTDGIGSGEFRRVLGSSGGGCTDHMKFNSATGQIACGTLTRGSFTMTVVPVPGAVWLFASALGLMGWLRRRATA